MAGKSYLAVDLGAESGRGILGRLEGGRLALTEVSRFPNRPVRLHDHLYWDYLSLCAGVEEALAAGLQQDADLRSVGVDTWGVDFGLLDGAGMLMANPIHYRDAWTEGVMERAFERMERAEIFRASGLQFLPFNTLYQLLALAEQHPRLLGEARSLLMMGELFTFHLTGERVAEWTNASTSQLADPVSRTWSQKILDAFELPGGILQEIVPPGARLGRLRGDVAERVGGQAEVVAPAVHDTASAVAAVPAEGSGWAYLSSGTWSLVGVETGAPVLTDAALDLNVTNEGGVEGRTRLLKNVAGLWLVQTCRQAWRQAGDDLSYEEIARLAAEAPAHQAWVEPDDPRFIAPGDMPARIQAFCRERGQSAPETPGQIARVCFESLAFKYRWVLDRLEELTGVSIYTLHIVGGGARNELLNQMTANASGRRVLAGPYEATATGNILVQAMADGEIADLAEGRALIRSSVELKRYEPASRGAWEDAYGRFLEATGLSGS